MEQKQCSLKDSRILLMNEILQGIKVKRYIKYLKYLKHQGEMIYQVQMFKVYCVKCERITLLRNLNLNDMLDIKLSMMC